MEGREVCDIEAVKNDDDNFKAIDPQENIKKE